jgi:5-methylcytosine-specific restriction endonuclease McrA
MAETIGIGALRRLLEEQNYTCAVSGATLTPEIATVDHKIPVTRGGGNTIGNLQIVTVDINRMKGNLTTEEFVSLCARVVDWSARKIVPPLSSANASSAA